MIFLLTFSIVLGVCKSALYNHYAKSQQPDTRGIFIFNAVSYGSAALVTFFIGVDRTLSPQTLYCAVAYAVTVFSLQALSVAAMTIGPMSMTSLLVLYGMIIPSLSGPLFWQESFGLLQIIGMIIMLSSLWLLRSKDTPNTKAGKRWGIIAGLCFLLSGMAGVIEKVHQSTDGREERLMFLLLSCLLMFFFSITGSLTVRKANCKTGASKTILLTGILSGAIISLYSQTNLILAGSLDSLIYYPIANGGALLLTIVISITVFHENLSGKRLAGFIMGLFSIVLLSLPVT